MRNVNAHELEHEGFHYYHQRCHKVHYAWHKEDEHMNIIAISSSLPGLQQALKAYSHSINFVRA